MKKKEPSPFYNLLYKTPAINIVPTARGLISLKDFHSLAAAVKTLSDNKILSAPVFDSQNNLVGMVDIFDIVTFLFSEKKGSSVKVKDGAISEEELKNLKKRSLSTKLKEVANASGRSPIVPFYGDNPLSLLIELFASSNKLHRVALFTKDGQLVRPCSQTDVVEFLSEHLEDTKEIKKLLSKSVGDIVSEYKHPVVTVHGSTPVKECLHKLVGVDIHGLAVLDGSGKLVQQFEFGSLRGLYESDFKDMGLGVLGFLAKHGATAKVGVPITVETSSTVSHLIQMFVKHKVHRLWVIDKEGAPRALVELNDVMRLIASKEKVTETQISGGITKLWYAFQTLDSAS